MLRDHLGAARLSVTAALFPLLVVLRAPPVLAQDTTRYVVSFPNVEHHEAEITVTFTDVRARPLELRMSRSSPGRYALHEFAKNVYSVRVTDGSGRPLEVMRPDPYQWDVEGHDGTVRVTYTLYADGADGTYSGIDRTHAHLNMPATFLWARGLDERPISVSFRPPAGVSWRAATQLVATADPLTFAAPNLYYFMDSPTELSDHAVRQWSVAGAGGAQTIRFTLHHQGTDAQLDSYVELVKRVVAEHVGVYGELPRFDYGTYTFIGDYLPWVYGDGMEHRNSTIVSSTGSLEQPMGVLGTVSHEFFHAWNVERMRPRALEPFNFERANMSRELWLAEGFTSYYGPLAIRRAGITDDDDYANTIGGAIDAVINSPGRQYFSPVEMSMQAPFVDAATAIDADNRINTFISYYTWGSVIGLGLDLTLRSRFDLTLDDFMRAMWRKYGVTEIPYTVADAQATLAEVTGDAGFAREFFDSYVWGTDVVDYEALLANAGFLLREAAPGMATFGDVDLQTRDGAVYVVSGTIIGSPLYDAGLDYGDRIVSVDGTQIGDPDLLAAIAARHRPGDTVQITFEQRGETRTDTVTLTEEAHLEVVTYEAAGMPVSPEMRAFRAAWLGSVAGR